MHDSRKTQWLLITGGDVILAGGHVLAGGCVVIQQGVIRDVLEAPPASILLGTDDVAVIDATGCWVTPGLVDQHLHGALGVDFNQSTRSEIQALMDQLPLYGITAVVPTVMTAPKLDMVVSLSNLEEIINNQRSDQARILGIHLEGPFLSPQYNGAHPAEDLLLPSEDNWKGLLPPSLKRMTLAPELPGAPALIRALVEEHVLVSLGHSGADFETTLAAQQAGALCVTHLFNAMAHHHHRHATIATAGLVLDDLYVEMITDGKHLSEQTIALVLKAKPFEKTIIISDCNALTGMPEGATMRFGKQKVTMQPGGALNEQGRLAGSTQLITDCVRNLVRWGLLSFPHAIQMATAHPAAHLGESNLVGALKPGGMGDVILWEQGTLDIQAVFLGGERVGEETSDWTTGAEQATNT